MISIYFKGVEKEMGKDGDGVVESRGKGWDRGVEGRRWTSPHESVVEWGLQKFLPGLHLNVFNIV